MNLTHRCFLLLFSVLLLGLAGCGILSLPSLILDENLPTGELVVRNSTNSAITSVGIVQCEHEMYGRNRLPGGAPINPGNERAFIMTVGCWKVAVESAEMSIRAEVDIDEDGALFDFYPRD